MAAVTICSDFEAPKNKIYDCFHCFSIYLPWSDGTRTIILFFWMLSFNPTFSLFFHFHQEFFSSSLLSALRVVLSAYVRLLIFLPEILIPACVSSSPALRMMYSAQKLNKQGECTALYSFPYLEPGHCSMSSSNCWFMTCIQICQEAGSGGLVFPCL